MIVKTAGGYQVKSHDGKKNLGGPYKTQLEALKRLGQIETFRAQKAGDGGELGDRLTPKTY